MDEKALAHLHGRIVALELMLRGFMAERALASADPAASLREWESGMMESFQHSSREVGDYQDAVWAEAVDAMRYQFREVRKRVDHLRS